MSMPGPYKLTWEPPPCPHEGQEGDWIEPFHWPYSGEIETDTPSKERGEQVSLRAVFIVLLCLVGTFCVAMIFIGWLRNPELSQMQVFLRFWQYHLAGAASLGLAAWLWKGKRGR